MAMNNIYQIQFVALAAFLAAFLVQEELQPCQKVLLLFKALELFPAF